MKLRVASVVLGSILGALFCGCSSTSYSPLDAPPSATAVTTPALPPPRPAAPAAPKEPPPEVIVIPHEPAAVIGLDNVDVGSPPLIPATTIITPPAPTPSFGTGWISLRTWTERCAAASTERSVAGGTTAYQILVREGTLRLTVGSRMAQWNGTAVWLGFAPQIVGGEPRIHALDAEKSLLPLVAMTAPSPRPTRKVVLDPGHGGSDSGTRGARGELEKIYSLDWALRTERLLTNAGWKVFLTRRSDVDVPLGERVAFADRVQGDLFISLHFNSTSPQTQPSGIETYCVTPRGMPSTLARGYADDEHAHFPNNNFDAANLELAYRVHRSLVTQTHSHDDGLKRARFMSVLRYQNRPAILVEGGFLSNARDAASIQSPAYRESLAQSIADALRQNDSSRK